MAATRTGDQCQGGATRKNARVRLTRPRTPGTRRARERLWRIPPTAWPPLAGRVVLHAARDRVTMVAASLAFHAFLGLLPVLIATVGLLGLVRLPSGELHSLVHAVGVLLPTQMASVIDHQLLQPSSRPTNVTEVVFGLAIALWSSVEATSALQVGLDVAYEVPHTRGFIGRRLMAFPLIGVTIVLGGAASVLLVLGGPIAHLVPSGLHPILTVLRYGGSLVMVTLLLSAYYDLGPSGGTSQWEWVSPGAVFAAVGWVLCALAFSFYLDHFGHESRDYGALAGVAVTLLWLFLTSLIILLGAELNRELERVVDAGAEPAQPAAGGEGG